MKIATKKDFRYDYFRSGGKGGQHQNKTNTGVRITHIPSGLSSECRETRSQLTNKERAFRKLAEKVVRWWLAQQEGLPEPEPMEEIRIYNLVDNRVTDKLTGEKFTADEILNNLDEALLTRLRAKKI